MRISYNWLKDFVEIKKSPEELAHLLTMAGLEVKGIEKKSGDVVFEIEITSNRPDWLSIIGVARELAAMTEKKFQIPNSNDEINSKTIKPKNQILKIDVQDKKACPLYTGCLIKDVKVGPSPKWLKKRLEVLGIRSINNIVDITNYVLLETGQPLHAFDYDKLTLPLIVRRAKDQEGILLLDGSQRKLDSDILVIADRNKAVAIAGVMGSIDSEVTNTTKNILLESAYFDPAIVRTAAKKLAISTDSSYRFERNVDCNFVEKASSYASKLILELSGGQISEFKNIGKSISKKRTILFTPELANRVLGINLSTAKIKTILKNLGITAKEKNTKLLLTVPTFREDLKTDVDIAEEVARIYGYDNIGSTSPYVMPQVREKTSYDLTNCIRDVLVGLGLTELTTYSLISDNFLIRSNQENLLLKIKELQSPLSSEFKFLRPTLLASLLNCASYNMNRKNQNLRLFEISNLFLEEEKKYLGIIICGGELVCFDKEKSITDNDFYYLKGLVENFFEKLKIKDYKFENIPQSIFSNKKSLTIFAGFKNIGYFGEIDKQIVDNFEIKLKKAIFFAQICLDDLLKVMPETIKYKPYSSYPAITRDISINLKEVIKYQDAADVIKNNAGQDLIRVKLVDVYRGKNIPENHKNFTFSLIWQAKDRTLEEKEIEQLHKNICDKLIQELSAQIR